MRESRITELNSKKKPLVIFHSYNEWLIQLGLAKGSIIQQYCSTSRSFTGTSILRLATDVRSLVRSLTMQAFRCC